MMPVISTDTAADDKAVVLWESIFDVAAYTSLGSDPLNPASNAINDSTYDFWKNGPAFANTSLRKTGSTPRSADALGISGHNLATTASTIRLRKSDNLEDWVDVITPFSPLTNDDLLFLFPVDVSPYWEILFGQSTSAYVSNVKLGRRLDFPCTPVVGYTPVHHSWRYDKYFNNSIQGQLLGNRVRSRGGATEVSFPEIPRQFVDGSMTGFENHYNRGRTFFYAGWPGGKPQDMGYCWASEETAKIDVTYTGGSKLATVNFGINIHG